MPRNPYCTRCDLHKSTSNVCLMGSGNKKAKIMLIGEAPGATEERGGEPFIGAAGKVLDKLLEEAGIERSDLFISNSVRCRPPSNRTPTDTEASACFMYLAEELEEIKPAVIIALGATALKLLTGKSKITAERGRPILPKAKMRVGNCTIIATFHPAALLYQSSKSMHDAIVQDFKYAAQLAGLTRTSKLSPHSSTLCLPDTTAMEVKEALRILEDCKVVAIDCEWTAVPESVRKSIAWPWTGPIYNNKKPELYSIAISGRVNDVIFSVGIALPQFDGKPAVLREFFKNHPVCGHNLPVDLIWLAQLEIDFKIAGDSMLLYHTFDEVARVNLQQLSTLNLGATQWKGPLWSDRPTKDSEWESLLTYNCTDVFYTILLNEEGMRQLKTKSPEEYENLNKLYTKVLLPEIPVFVEMALTGVPLDRDLLDEQIIYADMQKQLAAMAMAETTGLAPQRAVALANSPAQTTQYLRDVLGEAVTGSAKGDLIDLVDQYPIVEQIQSIRYWSKRKGTYLEPWRTLGEQQDDWRLHSVYRLTESRTGRTTAEVELGGSLQLVPRNDPKSNIKQVIRAKDGNVLVSGDLSNIEMRLAAWIASERNMIQLFNDGVDLHLATAMEVDRDATIQTALQMITESGSTLQKIEYKDAVQILSRAGLEAVTKDIKWKIRRQNAKGVGFGFLYGMQVEKFIKYAKAIFSLDFTREEAESARNVFFSAYPDLITWHKSGLDDVKRGYVVSPFGRYRRVLEDERKAINARVQSSATDLTAYIMINIHKNRHKFPCPIRFCGFVHDSIILECPEEYADEVAAIMKEMMEHPPLARLGIELPVPLVADITVKQALG